jgi:hypothetical protein
MFSHMLIVIDPRRRRPFGGGGANRNWGAWGHQPPSLYQKIDIFMGNIQKN